ncbi:MAG: hypothetical protein N2036_03990 [Bryobacteraceae bacterium]|nr:hypothetical protein [Bryobacteraceae bacterium]
MATALAGRIVSFALRGDAEERNPGHQRPADLKSLPDKQAGNSTFSRETALVPKTVSCLSTRELTQIACCLGVQLKAADIQLRTRILMKVVLVKNFLSGDDFLGAEEQPDASTELPITARLRENLPQIALAWRKAA